MTTPDNVLVSGKLAKDAVFSLYELQHMHGCDDDYPTSEKDPGQTDCEPHASFMY